jgi:hypothetical protein
MPAQSEPTPQPTCECATPLPVERAERKGAARLYCARCDRPLPVRMGTA